MRHGRGVVLATAVSTLLLCAGCAPEPTPGWSPASWPVAGEVLSAAPAPLDGDSLGLWPQRISNPEAGVEARWSLLPAQEPINAALSDAVRRAIDAQSAASGVPYRPAVGAPGAGLSERGCVRGSTLRPAADLVGERAGAVVTCDIVVAADTVFAERVRTVIASKDAVTFDQSTILYTDVSTGEVASARDLVADPGALWQAVVEVLRRDAGSLVLSPVGAPTDAQLASFTDALDTVVVADQRVVVTLAPGFTADELDGLEAWRDGGIDRTQIVALPVADVASALTPFGTRIAAAEGAFRPPSARGVGALSVDCALVPCMALTLDDGPSGLTPGILDVLRDTQSAGTFFMLGQNAQSHPDTVRRVAAEGHQIGNHTWNHPYLTELTDEQIRAQLGDTADLLRSLSGQPVDVFRPPGGYLDDRVLEIAGEPAIMWSVDTRDWAKPSDETLAGYAVETPAVGSIMLVHDIQPVTARVFPQIIDGLRDRGFTLVTIDQLFGGAVPSGVVRRGP